MFPRRTLPITLAVVMIVLLVALIVGWVLLAVFGLTSDPKGAMLYVTLLTVGTTFFVLLVLGVVVYLVMTMRAINLNRRQSNFIDAVTHELKSPIASLKLYLQTLSRHRMDEQQQTAFYRSMLEDCERLDDLINQILDAGRVEWAKADDDESETVPLDELLRETITTVCLRYRVPAECVRLDTVPCRLQAKRVDLYIIFRNLIDNAVKYAGDHPQVEVALRLAPDGLVTVRISDNGRGIPVRLRRKIFGRFERLGIELTRDKPGTGLGLYIVRTLIRRQRGRIRVLNREPGPGTVFEVHLPGGEPTTSVETPLPEPAVVPQVAPLAGGKAEASEIDASEGPTS